MDEFGGLEKAIGIARDLAGLPADKDVRRIVFPAPRPFLETWFGADEKSEAKSEEVQAAVLEALPADARRAFRYASLLDQMQKGQAILMMPYELRIK